MEYKFLSLMNNQEIKYLLADYGNKTGAEINNFLVRELIATMKSNGYHPILARLEKFIFDSSISAVKNEVFPYVGDFDFHIDDSELIAIIRENKNRIYSEQAKSKGFKSFVGNCHKHGFNQFSIRNNFYFCADCYEDGSSTVIFNPIRNLTLSLVIKCYCNGVIPIKKHTGIGVKKIWNYCKMVEKIGDKDWVLITRYMKELSNAK